MTISASPKAESGIAWPGQSDCQIWEMREQGSGWPGKLSARLNGRHLARNVSETYSCMGATTVTQSCRTWARFLRSYMCTATNGKYSTDVLCFSHCQITYQTDMTSKVMRMSRPELLCGIAVHSFRLHLPVSLNSLHGICFARRSQPNNAKGAQLVKVMCMSRPELLCGIAVHSFRLHLLVSSGAAVI